MALSNKAVEGLKRALTEDEVALEIKQAIDANGSGPAAHVALFGATTNLSLASPGAAALNAIFSDVEVETALGLKSDQAAVSAMMATAETRLDNLEAKINAIITALVNAGLML